MTGHYYHTRAFSELYPLGNLIYSAAFMAVYVPVIELTKINKEA